MVAVGCGTGLGITVGVIAGAGVGTGVLLGAQPTAISNGTSASMMSCLQCLFMAVPPLLIAKPGDTVWPIPEVGPILWTTDRPK
jgi:hypothetical protein